MNTKWKDTNHPTNRNHLTDKSTVQMKIDSDRQTDGRTVNKTTITTQERHCIRDYSMLPQSCDLPPLCRLVILWHGLRHPLRQTSQNRSPARRSFIKHTVNGCIIIISLNTWFNISFSNSTVAIITCVKKSRTFSYLFIQYLYAIWLYSIRSSE